MDGSSSRVETQVDSLEQNYGKAKLDESKLGGVDKHIEKEARCMTYKEVEAEVEALFRSQVLSKTIMQDEYDRNFCNRHAKKDSSAKLQIDMLCLSRGVKHSFSSYVGPKNVVQEYFRGRLARGEIDADYYSMNFRGCVARKGSEAHCLIARMVEAQKQSMHPKTLQPKGKLLS